MKYIGQFCLVATLTLVFTLQAFAGEMDTPLVPPPPPAATTLGEMDTPVAPTGQISNSEATYDNQAVFVIEDIMQIMLFAI